MQAYCSDCLAKMFTMYVQVQLIFSFNFINKLQVICLAEVGIGSFGNYNKAGIVLC